MIMLALSEQPILVIDSGVGGISVLRELVRQVPEENFTSGRLFALNAFYNMI